MNFEEITIDSAIIFYDDFIKNQLEDKILFLEIIFEETNKIFKEIEISDGNNNTMLMSLQLSHGRSFLKEIFIKSDLFFNNEYLENKTIFKIEEAKIYNDKISYSIMRVSDLFGMFYILKIQTFSYDRILQIYNNKLYIEEICLNFQKKLNEMNYNKKVKNYDNTLISEFNSWKNKNNV